MQHADILALAGLRVDGRKGDDIRSIRYKLGVSNSNSADGSCYFEQGTKSYIFIN
jgi:ribonuclease PH